MCVCVCVGVCVCVCVCVLVPHTLHANRISSAPFCIVTSAAYLSLPDIFHVMSKNGTIFMVWGTEEFTEFRTCVLLYPTTYV